MRPTPGTYSGSASNVAAVSVSSEPEERGDGGRAHAARPYSAGVAASASATIRSPRRVHRLGREHDAVGQHDLGQRLHVVGQRVVAALQQRARLGGAQQQQAGARAGAELDARVLARAVQQRDDVAAQGVGGVHAARGVLDGEQLGGGGHRLEHVDAVGDLVRARAWRPRPPTTGSPSRRAP